MGMWRLIRELVPVWRHGVLRISPIAAEMLSTRRSPSA